MSNIIEAKKAVAEFLKKYVKCYDVTVIKIEKVKDIWESVAEVYEDDSFLKSMNMPTKQVRHFYLIKMDENFEITAFERLSSYKGADYENR
jgi:hypothetical protein